MGLLVVEIHANRLTVVVEGLNSLNQWVFVELIFCVMGDVLPLVRITLVF